MIMQSLSNSMNDFSSTDQNGSPEPPVSPIECFADAAVDSVETGDGLLDTAEDEDSFTSGNSNQHHHRQEIADTPATQNFSLLSENKGKKMIFEVLIPFFWRTF